MKNVMGFGLIGVVIFAFCSIGMSADIKVVINEINVGDGYIELYNPGAAEVDLSGFGFLDKGYCSDHYQFPAGIKIPAGGYLIVYPDEGEGDTHTNWILEVDDMEFCLCSSDNETEIDVLMDAELTEELSYGRYPDGGEKWGEMDPSKGAKNKAHK